jgi:hypothetical protein
MFIKLPEEESYAPALLKCVDKHEIWAVSDSALARVNTAKRKYLSAWKES